MKSYYDILGVLPTAPKEVIKAAYRTLISIYHPDKYDGDKSYAHQRTAEINQAYDVLSDPEKRSSYDEDLKRSGDSNYFENSDESSEKVAERESIEKAWERATEYIESLDLHVNALTILSPSLAFLFKAFLLDSKRFNDASVIAETMKVDFLGTYFGEDADIQKYAMRLLKADRRDIAKELNSTIKIIGSSLDSQDLITKVDLKFAEKIDLEETVKAYVNTHELEVFKTWDGSYLSKRSREKIYTRQMGSPQSILNGYNSPRDYSPRNYKPRYVPSSEKDRPFSYKHEFVETPERSGNMLHLIFVPLIILVLWNVFSS